LREKGQADCTFDIQQTLSLPPVQLETKESLFNSLKRKGTRHSFIFEI